MADRVINLLYRNQSLTSLDLSHNKLGDKGGMLVAEALADVNLSRLESLTVRANQLGPETAYVLATSLSVKPRSHLAKLDICDNPLGTEGWGAIWEALRDAKESQISHWELYKQGIGTALAKSLAEYIEASPALTSINLLGNDFDAASAAMLVRVAEARRGATRTCACAPNRTLSTRAVRACRAAVARNVLAPKMVPLLPPVPQVKGISLCGIASDATEANFSWAGLRPPDAVLLAADLRRDGCSLELLNLACNYVNPEGGVAIAGALAVNTSLTTLDLRSSGLDADTNTALRRANKMRARHLSQLLLD